MAHFHLHRKLLCYSALVVQEVGGSLFAGKTAFDKAVKPVVSAAPQALAPQRAVQQEVSAAPQALAPQKVVQQEVSAAPQASATQSAFGAANEAGTGPDFGASTSQVRCSDHLLLADVLRLLLQIGTLVFCRLCCMCVPCCIARALGLTSDMLFPAGILAEKQKQCVVPTVKLLGVYCVVVSELAALLKKLQHGMSCAALRPVSFVFQDSGMHVRFD